MKKIKETVIPELPGLLHIASLHDVCGPLLAGLELVGIIDLLHTDRSTIDLLLLLVGGKRGYVPGVVVCKSRGVHVVVVGDVTGLRGEVSAVMARTHLEGVVLSDSRPDKIAHFSCKDVRREKKEREKEKESYFGVRKPWEMCQWLTTTRGSAVRERLQ